MLTFYWYITSGKKEGDPDVINYWEYRITGDTYTLHTEQNNDETVKIIK